MAITQTTASAAVTANDLIIPVTSATGFATSTTLPQWVKVDSEFMVINPSYNTAPYNGTSTSIPVYRRGDQGTKVAAHNALATVTTGLFSDLTDLQPGADNPVPRPVPFLPQTTYSVSGAITIPTHNTLVMLDKAGIAAMTLAAPSKDQDDLEITVTSNTAYAHTITATSLINDGVSGAPHTTATFAAYAGATITLLAQKGLWNVKSNNNVTIS